MKSKLLMLIVGLLFISACNLSNEEIDEIRNIDDDVVKEEEDFYDIEKVSSFVENKPTNDEINVLKKNANDKDCALRKSSVAVLFKYDDSYEEDFEKEFAIIDYIERSNGEYNFLEIEEIAKKIKEIENNPEVPNNFAVLINLFCEYQDKNIWVDTAQGKISQSRFFRGAFLVILEPERDTLSILNELDRKIEKQQLSKSLK